MEPRVLTFVTSSVSYWKNSKESADEVNGAQAYNIDPGPMRRVIAAIVVLDEHEQNSACDNSQGYSAYGKHHPTRPCLLANTKAPEVRDELGEMRDDQQSAV